MEKIYNSVATEVDFSIMYVFCAYLFGKVVKDEKAQT